MFEILKKINSGIDRVPSFSAVKKFQLPGFVEPTKVSWLVLVLRIVMITNASVMLPMEYLFMSISPVTFCGDV